MVEICGNKIMMSRGDSVSVEITFTDDVPADGTECVLTIKKFVNYKSVLVEKKTIVIDGQCTFELDPLDTFNIPFGSYKWDVRLFYEDGTVVTPIPPSSFEIIGVVGNEQEV